MPITINNKILFQFGANLRKMRIKMGYTLKQFAEIVNLHINYISDVELGKRNISLKAMFQMTTSLNIDLVDIVSFENKN